MLFPIKNYQIFLIFFIQIYFLIWLHISSHHYDYYYCYYFLIDDSLNMYFHFYYFFIHIISNYLHFKETFIISYGHEIIQKGFKMNFILIFFINHLLIIHFFADYSFNYLKIVIHPLKLLSLNYLILIFLKIFFLYHLII